MTKLKKISFHIFIVLLAILCVTSFDKHTAKADTDMGTVIAFYPEKPTIRLSYNETTQTAYLTGTGEMFGRMSNKYPNFLVPAGCKKVIVGEGITSLNDQLALPNSVEELILPESLQEITDFIEILQNGKDDLEESQLKSINIPSGVKDVSTPWIFKNAEKLEEITVDERNTVFYAIDGVFFDKRENRLMTYPKGKQDKEYAIPEGTEKVAPGAFDWNDYVEKITIPSTLKELEMGCFSCPNLKSVDAPVNNIEIICQNVFTETQIKELHIGAKTKDIHSLNIDTLEKLTIDPENPYYSVCDGALYEDKSKGLLEYLYHAEPSSIGFKVREGTEWIRSLSNPYFKSIYIPDSVIGISEDAFIGCDSLESIWLPVRTKYSSDPGIRPVVGTAFAPLFAGFSMMHVYYDEGVSQSTEENDYFTFYNPETKIIVVKPEVREGNSNQAAIDKIIASCERRGQTYEQSIDNGMCGDSVRWVVAGEELVLMGVGAMNDYSLTEEPPWNIYKDQIKKVYVHSGITSIGSYSFYSLDNMEMLYIGEGVEILGENYINPSYGNKVTCPKDSLAYKDAKNKGFEVEERQTFFENNLPSTVKECPGVQKEYAVDKLPVDEEMELLISQIDPEWTEYQKVLYVFSFLAQNFDYDYKLLSLVEGYPWPEEYDVDDIEPGIMPSKKHSDLCEQFFRRKQGICSSFAMSFVEIMSWLGIESETVTSEEINHAWNKVTIDGIKYLLDVTWSADPGNGIRTFKHFLVDDWTCRDSHRCADYDGEGCKKSVTEYFPGYREVPHCISVDNGVWYYSHYNKLYRYDWETHKRTEVFDTGYNSYNDTGLFDFSAIHVVNNKAYYGYSRGLPYNYGIMEYDLSTKEQTLIFALNPKYGKINSFRIKNGKLYVNNYYIRDIETPNNITDHGTETLDDGGKQYTLSYDVIDNDTVTITDFSTADNDVKVNIPSFINGHDVTKIGFKAFSENDKIAEVTIPETVNYVGTKAFDKSPNIVKFNNNMTDGVIGYKAFPDEERMYVYLMNEDDNMNTVERITVVKGEMWDDVSVPIRKGFYFMGYYSEKDGKGFSYIDANGKCCYPADFGGDTVLYAYWVDEDTGISASQREEQAVLRATYKRTLGDGTINLFTKPYISMEELEACLERDVRKAVTDETDTDVLEISVIDGIELKKDITIPYICKNIVIFKEIQTGSFTNATPYINVGRYTFETNACTKLICSFDIYGDPNDPGTFSMSPSGINGQNEIVIDHADTFNGGARSIKFISGLPLTLSNIATGDNEWGEDVTALICNRGVNIINGKWDIDEIAVAGKDGDSAVFNGNYSISKLSVSGLPLTVNGVCDIDEVNSENARITNYGYMCIYRYIMKCSTGNEDSNSGFAFENYGLLNLGAQYYGGSDEKTEINGTFYNEGIADIKFHRFNNTLINHKEDGTNHGILILQNVDVDNLYVDPGTITIDSSYLKINNLKLGSALANSGGNARLFIRDSKYYSDYKAMTISKSLLPRSDNYTVSFEIVKGTDIGNISLEYGGDTIIDPYGNRLSMDSFASEIQMEKMAKGHELFFADGNKKDYNLSAIYFDSQDEDVLCYCPVWEGNTVKYLKPEARMLPAPNIEKIEFTAVSGNKITNHAENDRLKLLLYMPFSEYSWGLPYVYNYPLIYDGKICDVILLDDSGLSADEISRLSSVAYNGSGADAEDRIVCVSDAERTIVHNSYIKYVKHLIENTYTCPRYILIGKTNRILEYGYMGKDFADPEYFTSEFLMDSMLGGISNKLEYYIEGGQEPDDPPEKGDDTENDDDKKPGEEDNKPSEEDKKPGEEDNKPGDGDKKPGEEGDKPGDGAAENNGDREGIWLEFSENYIYTGKAVKPDVLVHDGNDILISGKDYKINYKNNKNAAIGIGETASSIRPTIIVTGKGLFKDKLNETAYFNIYPVDISREGETLYGVSRNGMTNRVTPVIYADVNGKSNKLKKNRDFEIVNNIPVSQLTSDDPNLQDYSITVQGRGNYSGTITYPLRYVKDKNMLMSNAKVKLGIKGFVWDGTEKMPPVSEVKLAGSVLADSCYSVSYENNTGAGKATVTVTGDGINYFGRKTAYFTISGFNIKSAATLEITDMPAAGYDFTGKVIKPCVKVTLKNGGQELIENKDYTVSCNRLPLEPGKVAMTIYGKGGYTGKLSKSFKINKMDINSEFISVSCKKVAPYSKSGAKVSDLSVKYGSLPLLQGRDYIIIYQNNKKPVGTTASFQLKGLGRYTGITDMYTFEIVDASDDRLLEAVFVSGLVNVLQ